jgi:hypothetical protein
MKQTAVNQDNVRPLFRQTVIKRRLSSTKQTAVTRNIVKLYRPNRYLQKHMRTNLYQQQNCPADSNQLATDQKNWIKNIELM